jgi:nitric oxide dioxygenase
LFGYEHSEVVGRPLDPLVPDPYRARHRQGLAKAVARGATKAGDGSDPVARLPVVCRDGVIRRFPGRQALLKGPTGEVVAVAGVFAAVVDAELPAVFPVNGERPSPLHPDLVDVDAPDRTP